MNGSRGYWGQDVALSDKTYHERRGICNEVRSSNTGSKHLIKFPRGWDL